jgi:transketolase
MVECKNKKCNMDIKTNLEIITLAANLRNHSLKMALNAGKSGAHLGGGLSLIEVFAVLYGSVITDEKRNPTNPNHDRVIISKGHCVLSYYSVLNKYGLISDDDISNFETNGAILHGHATRDLSRGIEFSGGSLGLGLSYAIGVALAGKLNNQSYKVYVIVGDGECNEGIVWEAFMSAAHFKLDNLIVIIDHNKLQYDGDVSTVMNMGSLKEKLDVFGFISTEVDGHNVEQLYNAFMIKSPEKPQAIIANTVKGKGVSFMENKKEWHHSVLTQEQYELAMSEQTIKS